MIHQREKSEREKENGRCVKRRSYPSVMAGLQRARAQRDAALTARSHPPFRDRQSCHCVNKGFLSFSRKEKRKKIRDNRESINTEFIA